ncbi:MAG: hypothetical protein ABI347_02750 [Nitrososphaera sp.]|jgi:hypothetical protein
MPITINKNNGTNILTINNFSNVTIDAGGSSDALGDLGGDEKNAILIKSLGPTMQINFEYNLIDESSTVVTGSTVTTARAQLRYLYDTLMSTGANSYNDSYYLTLEFSSTPLDSGTATAGSSTTLTDGSKAWTINAYAGLGVKITGGTGSGQVRRIISNTSTALTISNGTDDGNQWGTNPDATSTYQIVDCFVRKRFVSKITAQSAADQPLSWRGNIQFQVGKVL